MKACILIAAVLLFTASCAIVPSSAPIPSLPQVPEHRLLDEIYQTLESGEIPRAVALAAFGALKAGANQDELELIVRAWLPHLNRSDRVYPCPATSSHTSIENCVVRWRGQQHVWLKDGRTFRLPENDSVLWAVDQVAGLLFTVESDGATKVRKLDDLTVTHDGQLDTDYPSPISALKPDGFAMWRVNGRYYLSVIDQHRVIRNFFLSLNSDSSISQQRCDECHADVLAHCQKSGQCSADDNYCCLENGTVLDLQLYSTALVGLSNGPDDSDITDFPAESGSAWQAFPATPPSAAEPPEIDLQTGCRSTMRPYGSNKIIFGCSANKSELSIVDPKSNRLRWKRLLQWENDTPAGVALAYGVTEDSTIGLIAVFGQKTVQLFSLGHGIPLSQAETPMNSFVFPPWLEYLNQAMIVDPVGPIRQVVVTEAGAVSVYAGGFWFMREAPVPFLPGSCEVERWTGVSHLDGVTPLVEYPARKLGLQCGERYTP